MESTANWTRVAGDLERSLAQPISKRNRDLLPKILQEWARTDLRDYLSREPRTTTLERIKKLESVRDSAEDLRKALRAIEGDNKTALIAQLLMTRGRRPHELRQAELSEKSVELDQHFRFLAELCAIEPKDFWKKGPGRPRNLTAYFVLQDAAAIYEWVAGKEASREIDRNVGAEISPFFRFGSVLWPVIFENGLKGLKAAMKNWASGRKKYGERSPLISNIALRHREWGLFER